MPEKSLESCVLYVCCVYVCVFHFRMERREGRRKSAEGIKKVQLDMCRKQYQRIGVSNGSARDREDVGKWMKGAGGEII